MESSMDNSSLLQKQQTVRKLNRIKLSRELMVRLTAALENSHQQTQNAHHLHKESISLDTSTRRRHNSGCRQVANSNSNSNPSTSTEEVNQQAVASTCSFGLAGELWGSSGGKAEVGSSTNDDDDDDESMNSCSIEWRQQNNKENFSTKMNVGIFVGCGGEKTTISKYTANDDDDDVEYNNLKKLKLKLKQQQKQRSYLNRNGYSSNKDIESHLTFTGRHRNFHFQQQQPKPKQVNFGQPQTLVVSVTSPPPASASAPSAGVSSLSAAAAAAAIERPTALSRRLCSAGFNAHRKQWSGTNGRRQKRELQNRLLQRKHKFLRLKQRRKHKCSRLSSSYGKYLQFLEANFVIIYRSIKSAASSSSSSSKKRFELQQAAGICKLPQRNWSNLQLVKRRRKSKLRQVKQQKPCSASCCCSCCLAALSQRSSSGQLLRSVDNCTCFSRTLVRQEAEVGGAQDFQMLDFKTTLSATKTRTTTTTTTRERNTNRQSGRKWLSSAAVASGGFETTKSIYLKQQDKSNNKRKLKISSNSCREEEEEEAAAKATGSNCNKKSSVIRKQQQQLKEAQKVKFALNKQQQQPNQRQKQSITNNKEENNNEETSSNLFKSSNKSSSEEDKSNKRLQIGFDGKLEIERNISSRSKLTCDSIEPTTKKLKCDAKLGFGNWWCFENYYGHSTGSSSSSSSGRWMKGKKEFTFTKFWPSSFIAIAVLLLIQWYLSESSSSSSMIKQVNGLQVSGGGGDDKTGSDELSRAVLATMSTQSPQTQANQLIQRPDLTTTNSSSSQTDIKLEFDKDLASPGGEDGGDILEKFLTFGRIFIMGAIIVGDICGNSLVILSVCRHSKLRVTTNWFVVSLACADILVALFAMTFNASVIISGRWLFKPWVCDFWNSCDVLASTASILHLCCISIDRYIAIMRPLDYPMKITTRRVVYALCGVWISSALLSYIPIFTGIYTTAEHIQWLKENPDQCEFVVNRVYAIVSSSISFWIPCFIMIFTYYRIYREATRQEKFIYKAQSMMPAPLTNHHHHHSNHHHHQTGNHHNSSSNKQQHNRSKQRRSKSVAVPTTGSRPSKLHHLKPANSGAIATTDLNSSGSIQAISASAATAGNGNKSLLGPTSGVQVSTEAARAASMLQLGTGLGTGNGASAAGGESEPLAKLSNDDQTSSSHTGSRVVVAFENEKKKPEAVAGDEEEEEEEEDDEPVDDSNSGQSTPTKRSISKMKREHKAAKTLGIIMGVFILCWFPFFSWYTPQHICGHTCDGFVPRGAVTILFWIGYFNSTLNPIIYAYFNHEFRDAFKKTLQWIFCCCQDLKCLRVNRPNDNQHYNTTYRSTQEIGLVSNS